MSGTGLRGRGAASESRSPVASSGGSAGAGPGRGVASVERAGDVLFHLARGRDSRGVTAIASEMGISKAVVHRILMSLLQRDLVAVDANTRLYSLGPGLLKLAAAYRSQLDIRVLALDVMRDLVEATQETSTLSVLHDGRRVYVDQVTPSREVKMTVDVGASFPLHAGASSKAFLAWLPEEGRRRCLESPLERLTAATIVNAGLLRRELSVIREQGFAVSLGERQHGAGSVAAPLLDEHLRPVAVISVCGPLQRFKAEVASVASEVVAASRTLSRKLGSPLEQDPPDREHLDRE